MQKFVEGWWKIVLQFHNAFKDQNIFWVLSHIISSYVHYHELQRFVVLNDHGDHILNQIKSQQTSELCDFGPKRQARSMNELMSYKGLC